MIKLDALRIKLEAAKEMVASCIKDKCYCEGLRMCMRCVMLNDLKLEIKNIEQEIRTIVPRFEYIKDAIDNGFMGKQEFIIPHKYPVETENKIVTLKMCVVQVQKGHYDLMEIGEQL